MVSVNITDTLIAHSSSQVDQINRQASQYKNESTYVEASAAAEDFEAVFLTQMLKIMFSGIETNEVFGGGHGEDVFKTFLFDEYGKVLSKAGGIGIAEDIQRSLLTTQEI